MVDQITHITDPQFFVDLDAMAQRCGAKAEDLLLIWTSETNLQSDMRYPPPSESNGWVAGDASYTFSSMMKNVMVPNAIDRATWARLPSMSHRQQLPIIERCVYAPAHRTLNRMFRDTFETYLVNAAPGMLRADGNYNPRSPMYVGGNYPDNWTMDNAPAGLRALLAAKIPMPRGWVPRDSYDFCKELVARGELKGYVSLGDLQTFGKRVLDGKLGSGTFSTAVTSLHEVRSQASPSDLPSGTTHVEEGIEGLSGHVAAVGAGTLPYKPDFDSSVSTGAPIDSRIATPEAARAKMPTRAGNSSPNHISWPVIGLGIATGIGIAVALNRK